MGEAIMTIHHALGYRGLINDAFVNNKGSIQLSLDRPIAPIAYGKNIGIFTICWLPDGERVA